MKLKGQCGQYDDESVYGSMRCRGKRGELRRQSGNYPGDTKIRSYERVAAVVHVTGSGFVVYLELVKQYSRC